MLKKSRVASLVVAALFFTAAAATAASPQWALRLRMLSSNYDHQFVSSYLTTTYLNVDHGRGFEGSAEFRPRQHVGLELSAGQVSMDARLRVTQLQPISFNPLVLREVTIFSSAGNFVVKPLSLALLVHPLRQSRIDFYVGPQIAWVHYDVGVLGAQGRDPEPGYGVKVGGEYLLGRSPWSVGVEYRRLELLHKNTERDLYGDIGLDVGSLMIGYRFGPPRR